jgi:hypothetical protein
MKKSTTVLLMLLACSMVGCSLQAPRGKLPPECSGIPGDFRTPKAMFEPGSATHGPGAPGHPIELQAVARPPELSSVIPLLYVYDPDGAYVSANHPLSEILTDPAFVQVGQEAYWGEIADGRYYLVPQLDKCSQAAMLKESVSFRAPPEGIMFMQFLAPFCSECTRITTAIEHFIAKNPDMPVRWVRVNVPGSIGSLKQ